jgi:cytochrome c5
VTLKFHSLKMLRGMPGKGVPTPLSDDLAVAALTFRFALALAGAAAVATLRFND